MTDILKRLAIGSASLSFLGETAVRAFLLYLVLNLAMRMMGRRLVSQMTSTDMATFATLGAAVGAPMHNGEVGIVASLLVLSMAICVYRLAAHLRQSRRLQGVLGEKPLALLKNGQLALAAMENAKISRDHLFSTLRSMGVEHLGQVERVYLESTGAFAVFFAVEPAPGLTILPDDDVEIRERQPGCGALKACARCGNISKESSSEVACCGDTEWVRAITARTASRPQRGREAEDSSKKKKAAATSAVTAMGPQ